jgi:hypothetical protein
MSAMTAYSPLLSLFALAPRLRQASGRAVSVYLPVREEGYDARFYDIEFGDLMHRYRNRLADKDRALMEHELPRLRAHLSLVRPAGCVAIAGFADEPARVLELVRLRASTDERLEVGELLIAPILRQLEQFPPALIAVVDKEHAMVFGAILEDIIAREQLEGADIKRMRAGGTSALSDQRKADNRTTANLEHAVKVVSRDMASWAFQQLYIAGPPEARSEFERLLPAALKRKVAGHMSVLIGSPTLKHDLREKLHAATPN